MPPARLTKRMTMGATDCTHSQGYAFFHLQRNCLELLILRRSARKLYTLGSDQFIIVSKTLGT